MTRQNVNYSKDKGQMKKRYLVLENGSIYEGEAFGAETDVMAELVFNTGMSGYQESITDLSYRGEMIVFTYPLIGNYGINRDDFESLRPAASAIVVHEIARRNVSQHMINLGLRKEGFIKNNGNARNYWR